MSASSGKLKTFWSRFARGYTVLAVMLLNACLCFAIINLVLFGVERYLDASRFVTYEDERLRLVYPGWETAEREAMLREVWYGRPRSCQPFSMFQEGEYDGQYVNVHSAGYRANQDMPPFPLDDEALNVFVFGGSTTFGYGLADWETLPAALQDVLRRQYPEQPVHVYNFGQALYFSSLELALFQRMLRSGNVPDVAIFVDGLNDLSWVPLRDAQQPDIEFHHGYRTFLQFSCTTNSLTLPVARFLPSSSPSYYDPDIIAASETQTNLMEAATRRWTQNYEMATALGREAGVQVIFVWQPIPQYGYNLQYHLFDAAEIHEYDVTPAYEAVRDLSQQSENILYLGDIQQARQEPLYLDVVHYTAAFSREIAQHIVDYMTTNQMLP